MSRPTRTALAFVALLTVSCSESSDADAAPENSPPAAVLGFMVAQTYEKHHYTGDEIDDRRSRDWLDGYLDNLDPAHIFFLQSDVDTFQGRYQAKLDDTIRDIPADLGPAFEMDQVYRERVAARIATVERVLSAPVSLDTDETVQLDREDAPWPATDAEADTLWTQRLKAELMRYRLQGMEEEESRERLLKRYKRFASDLDQEDSGDLLEAWLGALGMTFDPHSMWFKPARKDDFDIEMRDSLEGIGATLFPDGPYTTVRDLVPGGPAFKGGELKPKDKIIAVKQEGEEPVDIIDMRLDRVVKLIRGPKGTKVTLTVIPADAANDTETRDIVITRDKVKVAEAEAKGEVLEVDGLKVGVIDVPSFYTDVRSRGQSARAVNSTTTDMARILGEFQGQGVDAVVVDLRANGGGSLGQAVDASGLFIDKGPIVQIRDREGDVEVLDDEARGTAWDGPLVVLQSIYSASASEIFAGAMQDYGRGIVVGAQASHGKGTVQQLIDLTPMLSGVAGPKAGEMAGALKFTTDQFYRVSGKSTQNRGVLSDVVIPSPSDGLPVRENDLPFALPYHEIAPAKFRSLGLNVDIAELQDSSQARVAASEEFQAMAEIRKLREAREDKPISLNLENRKAEDAEYKKLVEQLTGKVQGAEDEAAPAPEDAPKPEEDEAKDPVLDEALAVTVDYVRMLK